MPRLRTPVLAGGVYAALLTPCKAGTTDADVAALLDYLDRPVNAGVDGIVLFGATGEFVHFDPAERARAAALAVRRSRVPVLVNISHSTMVGVLAIAEGLSRVAAAGVMLMPPYFYRYSDHDLHTFYQEASYVLDGQMPIYIYNLPAFTNPLSYGLISKILLLPGVVGIKDSSGDPGLMSDLLELHGRQEFRLLAGNEHLYAKARIAGADGVISGLSAAVPELIVALDRAILARDEESCNWHREQLRELICWVERLPPIVAIKEAAAFRGWVKAEHVLPLSPQTQATIADFRSWLSTWLPLMLARCAPSQIAER